MRIEVQVPNLPESVSDATLLNWHYAAGDTVMKDKSLIDLETDKVILEVPVPETGVLLEIRRSKGDVVSSGDLLAVIDTDTASNAVARNTVTPSLDKALLTSPSTPLTINQAVSPAVRRLLTEHNLSSSDIPVTGRITKEDVLNYISTKDSSIVSNAKDEDSSPVTQSRKGERRMPMTRLRARIAERMIESQQTK